MLSIASLLFQMKRNQWKSREELERLQEGRLKDLLRHASQNVPHYKKKFANPPPKSLEGLAGIGLTKKTELRSDPVSFVSSGCRLEELERSFTSGSTGIQVRLFTSRQESSFGMASELHHLTECGIGPLDLQARITHYETGANILQRMGLFRCAYLPVQGEDRANFARLRELSPGALLSYPSILLPLARLNSKNHAISPKAVFAGGEILSLQARKGISSSFECPIYDRYGSMETSWFAWECPEGSLHVQMDNAVVEITDGLGEPAKEGAIGQIVVTPLWRRAMPLIRYALGDCAALGPDCACGRGLPTLVNLQGRDDDAITLPSGRVRSARSINIMDDIPGMLAYQIIQETPERFLFRYVPADGLDDSAKSEVSRRIGLGCLGEKISVEFESVERISRGSTGKISTVVSKVPHKK